MQAKTGGLLADERWKFEIGAEMSSVGNDGEKDLAEKDFAQKDFTQSG